MDRPCPRSELCLLQAEGGDRGHPAYSSGWVGVDRGSRHRFACFVRCCGNLGPTRPPSLPTVLECECRRRSNTISRPRGIARAIPRAIPPVTPAPPRTPATRPTPRSMTSAVTRLPRSRSLHFIPQPFPSSCHRADISRLPHRPRRRTTENRQIQDPGTPGLPPPLSALAARC